MSDASSASGLPDNFVMPPCPAVLASVVRESRADEPDFRKISKLIMADIALSAAVLSTVNSAAYGLLRKVQSIHQALAYAGTESILQLITRLLLRQAFPVANGKLMERFWKHSARTALAVCKLARELDAANPDLAQTYGLFRDCGIPALLMNCTGAFSAEELRGLNTVQDFHELDKTQLGVDHTFIGAHLARQWFLPDEIASAIQHHHDEGIMANAPAGISPVTLSLIAIGDLAELVADSADPAAAIEEADEEAASAMARLGLSSQRFSEISGDIRPLLGAAG